MVYVAYRGDPASLGAAEKMIELFDFKQLSQGVAEGDAYVDREEKRFVVFSKVDCVEASYLDGALNADLLVFLSRHKSEKALSSLTAHVTGSPNTPGSLSTANAFAIKAALILLAKYRDELGLEYVVSIEATHHGPYGLKTPSVFIEIGGGEKQWVDEKAREALARCAFDIPDYRYSFDWVACVGVGGGHYSEKHTKCCLDTNLAVGHLFSRYSVPSITAELLEEAAQKTKPSCGTIALDWKGVRGYDRRRVLGFAEELGLGVLRL